MSKKLRKEAPQDTTILPVGQLIKELQACDFVHVRPDRNNPDVTLRYTVDGPLLDSVVAALIRFGNLDYELLSIAKQMSHEQWGWVIEHRDSDVSCPSYFDGCAWTKSGDNDKAIRYARQEDADRMNKMLDPPYLHRVREHGWYGRVAKAVDVLINK